MISGSCPQPYFRKGRSQEHEKLSTVDDGLVLGETLSEESLFFDFRLLVTHSFRLQEGITRKCRFGLPKDFPFPCTSHSRFKFASGHQFPSSGSRTLSSIVSQEDQRTRHTGLTLQNESILPTSLLHSTSKKAPHFLLSGHQLSQAFVRNPPHAP